MTFAHCIYEVMLYKATLSKNPGETTKCSDNLNVSSYFLSINSDKT